MIQPNGAANPKRIGILGGSFNPIHQGHIAFLRLCMERLALDRGCLVPVNDAYWKAGCRYEPASHRLAMCRLAAGPYPEIEVCDLEAGQQGATYTADTVRALSDRHPGAELYLLLGADVAAHVTRWKGFSELRERVTFVVARRPQDNGTGDCHRLADSGASCVWLEDWTPPPYSSTRIRAALGAGNGLAEGLDPAVLGYIKEWNLYRDVRTCIHKPQPTA